MSDNGDGQHVIEQVSPSPNTELPNLTTDEDIDIDNVANKGDMVADSNDESVIDVANEINGNTSDNATEIADDIIVDVDSDNMLSTVYLDGKRRSSRLSHVHGVFNLTIRRPIIDYGDTADNAVSDVFANFNLMRRDMVKPLW